MDNPYIYLFTRQDLSHPQQIVQTAHAVDEINKRTPAAVGTNFMVLCKCTTEQQLINISLWLQKRNIDHEMFYEPDISQYTAIATTPLTGKEQRKPMKRFQLLQAT